MLKAAEIACKVYTNSHDLAGQREVYGPLIRSPLPTAMDGSMTLNVKANYLLDDADNTDEFGQFEDFVVDLAMRPNQEMAMGAVVQGSYDKVSTNTVLLTIVLLASGCGKTHFAKVFTRKYRSIYLNLSKKENERTGVTPYKILAEGIRQLHQALMPPEPQLGDYEKFTSSSRALILLYFSCALEHYSSFLIACK